MKIDCRARLACRAEHLFRSSCLPGDFLESGAGAGLHRCRLVCRSAFCQRDVVQVNVRCNVRKILCGRFACRIGRRQRNTTNDGADAKGRMLMATEVPAVLTLQSLA